MALVIGAIGSCRRERDAPLESGGPPPDAVAAVPRVGADDASAVPPRPEAPPAVPARAAGDAGVSAPSPSPLMAEVQAIVEGGSDPAKLARLIGAHATEPDALLARKTALYVLKGVSPPRARLDALILAAAGGAVAPEADPLWPELVDALSETWDYENTAAGRRRMLRERDPRVRWLLVASMARYAGSSRGLSNLSNSERRGLRAELRSLHPKVPPEVRADIDATLPKLVHDSHVID